jgi:hypothetical protein
MSEDVLTEKDIVKAMLAMRDAKPRPAFYVGPAWARDHLLKHDGGKAGCARCLKSWNAMART